MTVDALPARGGGADSLDIRTIGVDVTLVEGGGRQQILLSDGSRRIQLALREGSLLDGPVRLRYALEGLADLEPRLLTLRRLAGLWRLGRMPLDLFPRDPRSPRRIEMLRTLDALSAGASQRDIAQALYAPRRLTDEWRGRSDYLRLRVQRLVRASKAMVGGGYLGLVGIGAARHAGAGRARAGRGPGGAAASAG